VGRVRGVNELELLIHSGMAVEDQQGNLQAQLAREVPSLENGLWRVLPDGRMETTWRLRPSAAWHDGTPVTPSDLIFTVRVGQEREVASFHHRGFEAIESVEQSAPDSVLVRWSQPFFEADYLFTSQANFGMPLPKHILEQAYDTDKGSFLDHPYWTVDFVGAGPFRVRELALGSYLLLGANDVYPLGRPKIDEVEVRFITDLSALIANLLSGDLDLTIGRAVSVEQAVSLRERWTQGKVVVEPGQSWTALYPQHVNPNPAVVADARFRRALEHALDRSEMVETLLHGVVLVAHSPIGPHRRDFSAVESSVVRYEYDPRRAAQLIESLGYTRGADGSFRDAAEAVLTVELRSTGGDDFRDREVLSIADSWQRNGVTTDVVFIPRQRATDREYRVLKPGFELVSQGAQLRDLYNLHSRVIPSAETRWVGTNRGRYSSPELDRLLDQFLVTIPRQERNGLLARVIHHITDQAVVMGVYHSANSTAISDRLMNVPGGDPWNPHQWDAKH
jgi:peptide/nickel transport system substrate-binding protein